MLDWPNFLLGMGRVSIELTYGNKHDGILEQMFGFLSEDFFGKVTLIKQGANFTQNG